MSKFYKFGWGKTLLPAILLFGLYGCGNETEDKEDLINDLTNLATVVAQDAIYSTGFSDQYQVDLSSRVLVSDGSEFIVTDVEEISSGDECKVQSITGTGFVVSAQSLKVCDYRYQVASKLSMESESQALIRLAVSKTPDQAQLPPISAVTLLNTPVDVDLTQELAKLGVDLDGFTLLSETTLPFNSGSEAVINPVNNVLTYTPAADFEGIDRVLFTYSNDSDQVLMGILDVAVSYEANEGLTVQDNIVYPQRININQKVDIDISPYVTSEDGDEYQLVYVGAFNAEVAAKNPTNTNNKVFTFQSSIVGEHTVSFAVSDHNGAYEMGLIKITTKDPAQSAKWGDIVYGVNRFTAPQTVADANYLGIPYSAILVDDGYNPAIYMTAYNYDSAQQNCKKLGGRLPTVSELQEMSEQIMPSSEKNWPAKYTYIVDQDGTGFQVDITGVTPPALANSNVYYSTCFLQGGLSVIQDGSDFEAVADGSDKAVLRVKLNAAGFDNVGKIITASVDSTNVSYETSAITNNQGIAEFTFTNFKAETVNVNIEYALLRTSASIVFIGDEMTAKLFLENVSDSYDYQRDLKKVRATLLDAYDNPIANKTVDISSASRDVLITSDFYTNEFGEQNASVQWISSEPDVLELVEINAEYHRGDGTILNASTDVKFVKAFSMCGGIINDTDRTNASGPCLKVIQQPEKNYLITATPSAEFMDTVKYSYSPDRLITEDGSRGPSGGRFMSWNYDIWNLYAGSDWCYKLNQIEFADRVDWMIYKFSPYSFMGNMFLNYGWPTGRYYSSTTQTPDNMVMSSDYFTGQQYVGVFDQVYISCVSYRK